MKATAQLTSLVLTFASLFAQANAMPADSDITPRAYRINVVERHGENIVELGATMLTVRQFLGEPARRIDRQHWVYANFQPASWKVDTGSCSTLLLTFSNGRVIDIKLVNDPAEKVIAASLQATSPDLHKVVIR